MDLKLSCIPVVAQRPCWVYKWFDHDGPRKKALFRGYTSKQSATMAVVEFEDGSIKVCNLNQIEFTESKSIIDSYSWDGEQHGKEVRQEVEEVDKADLLALAEELELEARGMKAFVYSSLITGADPCILVSDQIELNIERAERIRRACGVQ